MAMRKKSGKEILRSVLSLWYYRSGNNKFIADWYLIWYELKALYCGTKLNELSNEAAVESNNQYSL